MKTASPTSPQGERAEGEKNPALPRETNTSEPDQTPDQAPDQTPEQAQETKTEALVKAPSQDLKKKKTQSSPPTQLFDAPKKKRKWVKWLAILLIVGVCGYYFVFLPLKQAGQQMMSSIYIAQDAQVRDLTLSVSSTGTVTPIDSYNVTALVTGDIISAPFEEGGTVEKGQVLYEFDSYNGTNNLENAILNLERAQLTYSTTQEGLYPYATGAGVVQTLYVSVGDTVAPGTLLCDIVDNSNMTVKIPFHTSQVGELTPGQSATITLEATLEPLPATIVSVSGVEEIGAGNVILRQVEFRVSNPGALAQGATATASVFTSQGEVFSAASGAFENSSNHTVTASTSGEIVSLNVWEGAQVSRGTTIATLGGSTVHSNLESARISVDSARLSVESAQKAMENYTITSPISGTVIEKKFKAGDTLDSASLTAAGGNLAVIYDMTTLTFEMEIHELDINKIQLGQEVHIVADAVEGAEFRGYVDGLSINGVTVAGMTSYPITVVILDPEDLKPGMNVSAEVILDAVGQVLSVPVDAVIRGEDGAYVQVAPPAALDPEGNVIDFTLLERAKVELGVSDSSYIQILSGLEAGTFVAWENQVSNPFASMMGPPT